MPIKKIKETDTYRAVRKKGQAAIDKVRGKPAKGSKKKGSPYVGSGVIEHGKSAVIRARHRTDDALKDIGE